MRHVPYMGGVHRVLCPVEELGHPRNPHKVEIISSNLIGATTTTVVHSMVYVVVSMRVVVQRGTICMPVVGRWYGWPGLSMVVVDVLHYLVTGRLYVGKY